MLFAAPFKKKKKISYLISSSGQSLAEEAHSFAVVLVQGCAYETHLLLSLCVLPQLPLHWNNSKSASLTPFQPKLRGCSSGEPSVTQHPSAHPSFCYY